MNFIFMLKKISAKIELILDRLLYLNSIIYFYSSKIIR
tara:strand:- start:1263 stop:1376 length:114 start_codon:yes stop_codon:yes gene_type:complete